MSAKGFVTFGGLLLFFLFNTYIGAETVENKNGMIVSERCRFTVITPYCIRMEYSENGRFVDEKSLFAINREARYSDAKVEKKGDKITIDTGIISLKFTQDGKGFSAGNLQAVIKNGDKESVWNPDIKNSENLGGTEMTLDQWDGARKLSDGLLSRNGWFLYDDSKNHLFTDDWVTTRPINSGTDWYFFGYGKDYKAALKSLTTISGGIPLPRRYALGSWYSRYWPYTSDEYRQIVKEFEDHDFPLDGMVMDMDWHKDGWTGWSWNRKLLPDAEELLKWFHSQNLAVTLNVHPADGVAPHEDMYKEFMKELGEDSSTNKTVPFDAGNKRYLDIMFKHTHTPLEKEGVDFWWLDWQQYPGTKSIPTLSNVWWLNHYYYNHMAKNDLRGISFSRWGGWGNHRYPIQFSGDASTNWRMLAFEVPFTSAAGNVGCFFWSHDMGGHCGERNEESFTRWCQFGAFNTTLRLHSTREATLDRRPWSYPKWSEDSLRKSFHLRSMLFPYIYSTVKESCSESLPVVKPMYIEYPEDDNAYHNAQQYMFGDNILVAPIASPGIGANRLSSQIVWFPEGKWYNYFSGEKIEGKSERLIPADIMEFPVFVKAGVPVPMQPYTPKMTTEPLSELIVRCYPGEEGKTGKFTLYEDDGLTDKYKKGECAETNLSYSLKDGIVFINISPSKGSYQGQIEKRSYIIELPNTNKAAMVKVDGKEVQSEYDSKELINIIKVSDRNIREAVSVEVKASEVSPDVFANKAFIRRAELKDADTNSISIKAKIASMAAVLDNEYAKNLALKSAGIGLVKRNTEPYLFPDNSRFCFMAPVNFIDDSMITWTLESPEFEVLFESKQKLNLVSYEPEDIEKTIAAIGKIYLKPLLLKVSFNIDGKKFVVFSQRKMNKSYLSSDNLALKAKITCSSTESGYSENGVNDGIPDGHPNAKKHEWASNAEKEGAWIKLKWDTEQVISSIALFDRPNPTDRVISGEIIFSDGTVEKFGELENDASEGTVIKINQKKTSEITVKVTGVKKGTKNAGLSEIVVLK